MESQQPPKWLRQLIQYDEQRRRRPARSATTRYAQVDGDPAEEEQPPAAKRRRVVLDLTDPWVDRDRDPESIQTALGFLLWMPQQQWHRVLANERVPWGPLDAMSRTLSESRKTAGGENPTEGTEFFVLDAQWQKVVERLRALDDYVRELIIHQYLLHDSGVRQESGEFYSNEDALVQGWVRERFDEIMRGEPSQPLLRNQPDTTLFSQVYVMYDNFWRGSTDTGVSIINDDARRFQVRGESRPNKPTTEVPTLWDVRPSEVAQAAVRLIDDGVPRSDKTRWQVIAGDLADKYTYDMIGSWAKTPWQTLPRLEGVSREQRDEIQRKLAQLFFVRFRTEFRTAIADQRSQIILSPALLQQTAKHWKWLRRLGNYKQRNFGGASTDGRNFPTLPLRWAEAVAKSHRLRDVMRVPGDKDFAPLLTATNARMAVAPPRKRAPVDVEDIERAGLSDLDVPGEFLERALRLRPPERPVSRYHPTTIEALARSLLPATAENGRALLLYYAVLLRTHYAERPNHIVKWLFVELARVYPGFHRLSAAYSPGSDKFIPDSVLEYETLLPPGTDIRQFELPPVRTSVYYYPFPVLSPSGGSRRGSGSMVLYAVVNDDTWPIADTPTSAMPESGAMSRLYVMSRVAELSGLVEEVRNAVTPQAVEHVAVRERLTEEESLERLVEPVQKRLTEWLVADRHYDFWRQLLRLLVSENLQRISERIDRRAISETVRQIKDELQQR